MYKWTVSLIIRDECNNVYMYYSNIRCNRWAWYGLVHYKLAMIMYIIECLLVC